MFFFVLDACRGLRRNIDAVDCDHDDVGDDVVDTLYR